MKLIKEKERITKRKHLKIARISTCCILGKIIRLSVTKIITEDLSISTEVHKEILLDHVNLKKYN